MPRNRGNFINMVATASVNPWPVESGGFCCKNASNISKVGHGSMGPSDNPPPPLPESPGKLFLRGPRDSSSSSDITTSGNPCAVTRASNPSVRESGKSWFSSINFTKSGNFSVTEFEKS
jgi:hypothetical protein